MHVKISHTIRVLAFTAALLWAFLAFRLLTFLLLAVLIIAVLLFPPLRRCHVEYLAMAVLIFAPLSPFDISFRDMPGQSRFVRYVMGLPAKATQERAARGELLLGGCMTTGLEPKWIWVW